MKYFAMVIFSTILLTASVNTFADADKANVEAQRQQLQAATETALVQLYGQMPSAKGEIEKATGYAVFPVNGSSASGGILHYNRDGKDLYMKMISVGEADIDNGDFNLVMVFSTGEAIDNFRDVSWDVSGQLNSNEGSPTTGVGVSGAASVMPGTTVYQFNKDKMVDQPNLQDTKFVMNEKLN